MTDPTDYRAGSGRGSRRSGGARPDPADLRQLADSPVSLRRIARLFAPHRPALAVVVALIVLSSAVGLAQPFLVRHVIDDALPRQDVRLLLLLVGAMLGVAIATAVIGVVQTWLSTSVGQQVMHRLRSDLFAHLQRQSLDFFTRTRGGEVQSRLVNDIGGMQGVVTQTATSIAANVTVVVGTAVAMVALSWRLALISLVVLPPAVLLTRQVARMRHRITAERQRRHADLHVQIEEGLSVSGVLLTKTLGASPHLTARFDETSSDLVGLEIRSRLAGRWRMATMNVVFAAVPAAIYLTAGFPATSGGMTIGTLVAFIALQGGLFRPLMGLLNVGVDLTASMALFSRIFEYADLPVDLAEPPTRPAWTAGPPRARCASRASASPTTPTGRSSPTSTWWSPRAPRSRWSGRPAAASRPSPPSSPACATSPRVGCSWTTSTYATCPPRTSPPWWAWSPRRPT